MGQEYGILVSSPQLGREPQLLTLFDGETRVYRTKNMGDAQDQAKEQLGIFSDKEMVCSVVPLTGDDFGQPIKRYGFDGSGAREIKS